MAQDVRDHLLPADPRASQSRLVEYLRLALVPNVGWHTLARVAQQCDAHPRDLLTYSNEALIALGFNALQRAAITQSNSLNIELALDWLGGSPSRFIIDIEHPAYPDLLKQISSPPLLLFGEGAVEVLNELQLAIVGSRKPTEGAKQIANQFAYELCQAGFAITSGLAYGVDACAHQGALRSAGKTIAVLGSGLENVYPKRNRQLANQIIDAGGVVVSEFFPNAAPKAEHFPRRNRIVSGLSKGTLIVEAALKSGSLITARYAIEQNREVFAIPGNINNPLASGCHFLIKQGAKLVTNLEDICEEFQNVNSHMLQSTISTNEKSQANSLARDQLLDSVEHDVTALDVILQRTMLPIEVVLAQLLEYELRGLVASVSGGYVKLRGK